MSTTRLPGPSPAATANPHLLINQSTGGGTGPVNRDYTQQTMRRAGITARAAAESNLLPWPQRWAGSAGSVSAS